MKRKAKTTEQKEVVIEAKTINETVILPLSKELIELAEKILAAKDKVPEAVKASPESEKKDEEWFYTITDRGVGISKWKSEEGITGGPFPTFSAAKDNALKFTMTLSQGSRRARKPK